jgi:PAS domain S-box-containing protein
VSCRNVLIYFDIPLQRRVLSAFHYGLLDNGVLLLGKTESLGVHSGLFTIVDRKLKVFRKNLAEQVPFSMAQPAIQQVLPGKLPRAEASPLIDLEKEADQMLWQRASFAGLVVNDDLQILHFRGDTSPYLRPVPGKASLQLMRILREEMVLDVRSAIQKVRRGGKTVRAEGIELRTNQHSITVNVEVCPLVPTGTARSFLILFEPASTKPAARASAARPGRVVKTRETQEVIRLRADIARTRDYVQSIIRDQETANEELKTANEEALSSMEELQSTNEELETAKEELQSSNEELVTLNEQLQNRNSELGVLSNDLGNVLSGIDIPVVLLDSNGRIRRFTPPAEKLLGLIGPDVGRPIGKLRLGVHVPDMEDLLSTVIARGKEVSREVKTDSGHWFQLRMRPFRGAEEKVKGVLLAFVDIHQLRQHQDTLQSDRNFISAILDAAKYLLVVVLDLEGRIVHFNHACQQLTGYTLDEAKGRYVWDFLVPPEEAASAKAAFAALEGPAGNLRENHWIAKNGRRPLISWSHTVARGGGGAEFMIVTGLDVTELQQARRQAEQSGATVLAVMESSAQAILASGQDGRIAIANPRAEKIFGYSAGALLGQPLEALLPERFRTAYVHLRDGWFAEPRICTGLELAGLRQNGSEFPIEASLSHISASGGILGVAFVSDITGRKMNEQTLLDYKDQLQKLTGALIAARETSNREIARELHDVFSQELAALGMEISSLKEPGRSETELSARLSELGKRVGRLAVNVHETSRKLHPAILEDLGLRVALEQECQSFEQRSEIPTQFTAAGVAGKLPLELSLTLYRAAQECLRNIQKHAPASDSVQVALTRGPDGVTLRVADTGGGFDLARTMRKGGLGLISMEERVRTVNGKLTVESEPGKGTTVTAFVPLE